MKLQFGIQKNDKIFCFQVFSNDIDSFKKSTIMWDHIPPKIKIAAAIRVLSTGVNYADLKHVSSRHNYLQSIRPLFDPYLCA